jgi:hypothetical protein
MPVAARRSASQRTQVADFIRDLYERSGCGTWSEFAKKAGVHWAAISDWQTGKVVPDGWNLLSLIRAAGVTVEELVRKQAARQPHRPRAGSRPEGLEELVATQRDLIESLQKTVSLLEVRGGPDETGR